MKNEKDEEQPPRPDGRDHISLMGELPSVVDTTPRGIKYLSSSVVGSCP